MPYIMENSNYENITFQAILEAFPAAIQILDSEGIFIDCNEMSVEMLQTRSKEDIIGKTPSIFSPEYQPDGRLSSDSAINYFKLAFKGLQQNFDWIYKKFSGETFPAKVTLNKLEYNGIPCLMATVIDLTHESQLIDKVKKQADELITLIKVSPVPIIITDPDFNVKIGNDAALLLTGYTREVLFHENICNFEVMEQTGDSLDILIIDNKESSATEVIRFPSGVKIVRRSGIPVKDDSGKITQLLFAYMDMTEQARLGQEMADKAAWYESILDAIPLAVSVVDLKQNWTFLNRETEKTSGIIRSDVVGRPWSDFMSDLPGCSNPFNLFKNGIESSEKRYKEKLYQTQYAYVHDAQGNNIGMMEVVVDVTPMKKVSDYLERSVHLVAEDIKRLASGRIDLSTQTLDADEYTKEAQEYFVTINQALNVARMSLSMLVEDSRYIASSALEGYLKVRADPDTHNGEFREVIEGINNTLDSIVKPITEGMRIAGEYAACNFTARVDPKKPFYEDWTQFKEALDNIGVEVSQALNKISIEMSLLTNNTFSASSHVAHEISRAASKLVKNVEKVSENAKYGSEGIKSLHEAMDNFVITVGEVSSMTDLRSLF